jgi:subtilase family serine protease
VLLFLYSVAVGSTGHVYPSGPTIARGDVAVVLENWATVPLSSTTPDAYPPAIDFRESLSRVSVMRFEPGSRPEFATRAFVGDLNRALAIVDLASRSFVTYINFEEVFPKFVNRSSLGSGFVTLAFDPEYELNGRIYTVHVEGPSRPGSEMPSNASLPGLDLSGYSTTPAINPPEGEVVRHAVLIEWTDRDLTNAAFEGVAREVLRVGFNYSNHSIGDMLFNPTATRGHWDYGNLYVAIGDGGAGLRDGEPHATPQRLDALPGKIIRITPDTSLRPADLLAANGQYRVPSTGPEANPFVALSLPGLRPEIFAYGLRNPQRLAWDALTNVAFIADIGLASWEEVNILRRGANYGYAEREGSEQLWIGGPNDRLTGSQAVPPTPFPDPDELIVEGLPPVVPHYPVAVYSHRDGDAVAGGFVYRGTRLTHLQGKYVFGDITTGRLLYADVAEMIAADDGDPATVATIRELQILFDDPADSPDGGLGFTRLFDIVAGANASRGGTPGDGAALPAPSDHISDGLDPDGVAYGGGRADIRFAVDRAGELYILSKGDGMIRAVTDTQLHPPTIPDNFELAVAFEGSGSGVVKSAPWGIDCAAACAARFRAGTHVTLLPQASPLSVFTGWTGACTGTGSCVLTLNDAAAVTATFVASAADLAAAVGPVAAVTAPGARVTVSDTTTNSGNTAAGTSTTRYYLSLDALKNTGDIVLGYRSLAALEPSASSTGGGSLTVPNSVTLGAYYLLACADDNSRVVESNEQNNCSASSATITVTKPDLVVTALSTPPSSIAPGKSFGATDTVFNKGFYASTTTTTRYYLSIDGNKGAGDILLSGTRSVPSVAANGASTGSKTVTVPAATPLGTYLLIACADDTSKSSELDETNNCRASTNTVLVGRPDLVTVAVSNPPLEIAPGKTFSVTSTTANHGNTDAGASTIRYYLSFDDAKGVGDVLLTGSRSLSTLAAGNQIVTSRSVTVPAGTADGAYRVLACADDSAVVVEHDEGNNCGASASAIQIRRPDLVQISVSNPPATGVPGSSFTVTDSVRNDGQIGTGTTSTRYYLSLDSAKNAGDILLTGTRSVSGLLPGSTNTGSKSVTIPSSAPSGTYFLLACADDSGSAVESREDNNCAVSAVAATIP